MGIFDEIFDHKQKKEPSEIDAIFKRKPTVERNVADKQFQSIEDAEQCARLPAPDGTEFKINFQNDTIEDDEDENTMDFNALANVGASIEIGDFLESDDEITIYVEPSKTDIMGRIYVVRKVIDEDEDTKTVSEIASESYKKTDIEGLKQGIKSVMKKVKKLLVDEDAAYETLNDYLDEIEDELDE